MNFSTPLAGVSHPPLRTRLWCPGNATFKQIMRISGLFLVLMLMSLQMLMATDGNGQTAKVTLELNRESLETALKKIERLTPYRFIYRNEEIRDVENLTLAKAERTVDETLTLLLEETGLTFRLMKQNILIVKREQGSPLDQAVISPDAFQVSGTVYSADDGSPLPGVSVLVKDNQAGAVTDAAGKYTIMVPSESSILIFSFIGYKTMEVDVQARSVVDVRLEIDITQLAEVVVTSFGIEQEKRSLGFSSQEVSGENLIASRQANLVSALQGQVSGVQITNAGGGPGTGARILIRGITSLNTTANNQPLFIIDGLPIDNSTYESPNTPRNMSNRAADINPNDIESINILKGAAASALYGVRAANGAVVITTKKGKSGSISVNASSSLGFQSVNKFPKFQEEYGQGWYGIADLTSVYPAWGAPFSSQSIIDPNYRYYDNFPNAMDQGRTLDNYISVSGGNDVATFFASVANTDQKGVIPASTWDRTSVKFSGAVNHKDRFKVSADVTYSNSGGNRVPGDRFGELIVYYPTSSDVTDYLKPDGTQKNIGLSDQPIYSAKFRPYEDDVNRILGSLFFSYKPIKGLSLNYRIGSDFYSDFREEILPGPQGIVGERALSATGMIQQTQINNRILNSNFFAEYNRELNQDLKLTLRAGTELFQEDFDRMVSTGNTFVIPGFYHFSNATQILAAQTISKRRLIGGYGDVMVNYKDFVYLNVTGRKDWTSTLPIGQNSFFYPSVNLSFVFTDLVQVPAISYGKIRASYGQVGKDTKAYLTSTTYSSASTYAFPLNGQVGFTRNQVKGSENLKPERTTSIEFGADMKFLDNRVGLEVTWYKANSADQIFEVPVSNATGYTRFVANAGEIENKGIELLLTATPVRTGDLTWDVTLNFTRNRNTVVDLAKGFEGGFIIGTQSGYIGSTVSMALTEGAPYGNLYGRSFQRYYPTAPTGLTELDRSRPLLIGANGFPQINTTQLILGNAQAKWLMGINNNISYKGITLSALIDIRYGNDQYNQYGNFLAAFGKETYSLNRNDVVVFDGVLADGTPNTTEVWLGQGLGPDGVNYGDGFYRNIFRGSSEPFVQDASFVKLRNVMLSYALPGSIMSKTPFKSASISAGVNNIILWTPWSGYDPESFSGGAGTNVTGFTGLDYPGVRTTTFSLNLTL